MLLLKFLMGCGNTKTNDDEEQPKNEKNINDYNNNENNNINNNENNNENINEDNNVINKEQKIEKKIINKIVKEKKVETNKIIEKDKKMNGQVTKISFRENEQIKNYEDYNEENDSGEEKKEDEEEKKQKEYMERKEFLVNLKFKSIFKEDNIDKNNTTIVLDTSQKVKTTFIPSQKYLPKVIKYHDPIQGVKGPFWEINLEASKNEIMYPLLIEKNKEIIFYINGNWKINDDLQCDCNGISEIKNNYEEYMPNKVKYKFNKGALIGRVIYGEPFQIYDGLRYKSNYDGPLILKMNLNSLWAKENPSGSLNIKIKGVFYVDNVNEMEERIGWRKQLKIIELNNLKDLPDYKIPSLEKMIIILFNKARFNSKLFANQYLDNMKSLTPNSIKLYNEFINNTKQNLPFKINISIVNFLQKFYGPFLSGNNDNNNNDSLIILKTSKIIKTYLNKCFNNKKNIFSISIIKYKDKNPFHLASRLLFEDEIRQNIFKSNCEEMSMMTMNTREGYKKNSFYTIIVLSNEKGNDSLNYDISKNIKNFINEEQKNSNDNIISMIKINLNPLPNIFSNNKIL